MNKLLDIILKERQGHYCHVIEVEHVSEIESIIESVVSNYQGMHGLKESDFIEFFESMQVYSLSDDDATTEDIYDFNFKEYMKGTID